MTQVDSQASGPPEGRLAAMSRWATAPLVIPLLTGLSFVGSTVFAFVTFWQGFFGDEGKDLRVLPMAILCLIVGICLGFPLRRTMMRIRDEGQPRADNWVVVGVALAWLLLLFVQYTIFYALSL
jgi:cation transport ATPase